MAQITGVQHLSPIPLYASDTTAAYASYQGMRMNGSQGKQFVFVYSGGTALTVANVIQSPVIDAQFDDMVVPAAVAAGVSQVTVTNGTTTVVANLYVGGTLVSSDGHEYTILSHNTPTSGQAFVLGLDRGLDVAWTTSTTVTVRNLYGGVIQMPTTPTGTVLGVAIYALPINTYGWIQCKGTCGALSDNSTGAAGSAIANSTATAGAVGVFVAGTTRTYVGRAHRALSSAKIIPVYLDL